MKLSSCLLFLAFTIASRAVEPCRIEIVEERTGWPVPLVELRTTHHARFVSDNAGRIAFDLPELMGRETWFEVHHSRFPIMYLVDEAPIIALAVEFNNTLLDPVLIFPLVKVSVPDIETSPEVSVAVVPPV